MGSLFREDEGVLLTSVAGQGGGQLRLLFLVQGLAAVDVKERRRVLRTTRLKRIDLRHTGHGF